MSGNHAKHSSASYYNRTKALHCQKSTHLEPKREASLFCLSPSLLQDPIFLLCWLGSKKGIFIMVSLLEVKVPWVVESEETLPCFPLLILQPSQQLLWDREQHMSSSMRNSSSLCRWAVWSRNVLKSVKVRSPMYNVYMHLSTHAPVDDFILTWIFSTAEYFYQLWKHLLYNHQLQSKERKDEPSR